MIDMATENHVSGCYIKESVCSLEIIHFKDTPQVRFIYIFWSNWNFDLNLCCYSSCTRSILLLNIHLEFYNGERYCNYFGF